MALYVFFSIHDCLYTCICSQSMACLQILCEMYFISIPLVRIFRILFSQSRTVSLQIFVDVPLSLRIGVKRHWTLSCILGRSSSIAVGHCWPKTEVLNFCVAEFVGVMFYCLQNLNEPMHRNLPHPLISSKHKCTYILDIWNGPFVRYEQLPSKMKRFQSSIICWLTKIAKMTQPWILVCIWCGMACMVAWCIMTFMSYYII